MGQIVKALPDHGEQESELRQLRECIGTVRRELNQAYTAFNMADDEDLVESCVFEINALQARYNYLLKRAKWLEAAT